jgi:glutaminyl-tRNA synthetase
VAQALKVAGDDDEETESAERDFRDDINPASIQVVTAQVEPALAAAAPEARYQFERAGYFVADRDDHAPGAPVYNRTVTLKDSWSAKG